MIGSVVAGSQGLVKTGGGRLVLEGDQNTIFGTLGLQEGSLQIRGSGSLGQIFEIAVENPVEFYAASDAAVAIDASRFMTLAAELTVRGPEDGNQQVEIAAPMSGAGGSPWPAPRPT